VSFLRKLFGGRKTDEAPPALAAAQRPPATPAVDLSAAGQLVDVEGIDWRGEAQLEFLRRMPELLTPAFQDFIASPPFVGNPECSPADAAVHFAMAAAHQPGRIMEVGSGFTTMVLRHAKEDLALPGELITVDPEPRYEIGEFVDAQLIMPVQDVPLDDFRMLQPGEMAFFDTTHIFAPGSDASHVITQILPALPKGVLVGFHGVRLPRNYERDELERGYSEQAELLKFLRGRKVDVLFSGGWLAENHRHALKALPAAAEVPTAFWYIS
jgi:hypothetical protein